MMLLGWLGVVLLVASVVLAILARRRLWGLRLRPAAPSSTPPQGSVLLAARAIRGTTMEITPLLADWQARGVLRVERRGADLPMGGGNSVASGPEWHFTVLDASTVDAIELPLLRILVPDAPATGASAVLLQTDAKARDRLFEAVYAAITRQRLAFGPTPSGESLPAVGLVVLTVLAWIAAVVGLAVAGANPVATASAFLGGLFALVTVVLLCRRASRPSDAERRYRQAVVDFGAWLPTASPDVRLAGWAMVWGLPGAWATALPESITSLRGRDRDFLRGDFARRTPDPVSL